MTEEFRLAAKAGDLTKVSDLLAKGVDVNVPSSDGWTALDFAIKYGQNEMAQFLIERGARQNKRDSYDPHYHWARYLNAIANTLSQDSASWRELHQLDPQYKHEREQKIQTLWRFSAQCGAILVRLAHTGGLDSLPRLRGVTLQQWSALKKVVDSGEVPSTWRSATHFTSLDVILVNICEDVCRLWRGKSKGYVWQNGREIETANTIVTTISSLADHLMQLNQPASR